tara:strand:+ start:11503 stop:12210 length:708 start_codon:yes stop_codon:yes gene_type:complete
MSSDFNFSTFLLISKKKIIISVYRENNFEKIYEKELLLVDQLEPINYHKLDNFLNDNIFSIEKIVNNFIKKIILIIDTDQFFLIRLSIKKKDFENLVDLKSLSYLINEAKENCKKTIDERRIIHLIIRNYKIGNQNYDSLPKDLNNKNFSIDLEFICLSNEIIKNLEKTLSKYQISIGQIVNADYIREFFTNEDNEDIFFMTKKILSGYNSNEVTLVDKSNKNQGFFEKFFNFFN